MSLYTHLHKFQRRLLIIGCSFITLGAANIIYGDYKTQQYVDMLSASPTTAPQDSAQSATQSAIDKYLSLNSYQDQISFTKTRIEFYELTQVGGRLFLTAGGICLVLALLLFGGRSFTDISDKNSDRAVN